MRTFFWIVFSLSSAVAFCQPGPNNQQCENGFQNGFLHRERVWSPDCRSYFVISRDPFYPTEAHTLRVYRVQNKKMDRVSYPLQELMCDLAIETLACTTEVEQVGWIGSDRLRLRVRMLCGANHDKRGRTYVVDARTGHVLDPTGPQRNWSCPQRSASEGLVPRHMTQRPIGYH